MGGEGATKCFPAKNGFPPPSPPVIPPLGGYFQVKLFHFVLKKVLKKSNTNQLLSLNHCSGPWLAEVVLLLLLFFQVLTFIVQGRLSVVLLSPPKLLVAPKLIVTALKLEVVPKPAAAPVIPPMEVVVLVPVVVLVLVLEVVVLILRRSKWWKPDYSVKFCPAGLSLVEPA